MSAELYQSKSREYYGVVKRGVIGFIADKSLGNILDVGGGDGATVSYLIEQGRASSAYVLDPYSEAESTECIKFSQADANDQKTFERISQSGQSFDTVMFLDVLEHLTDPWKTLKDVRKVLKDDGELIVCMPNARFVALVVPLVFWGRFDYKVSGIMDWTHIRWFTRATTIELIEGAGYRVDRIDAVIEPRVKRANWLTLGLLRRFFEYQYVVQARKVPL